MATIESKLLKNLKGDPETGRSGREELEYYVTFPGGFDPAQPYGVAFCITGHGDTADAPYQMNELRPYIADKYNVIAVGVRYHNDARVTGKYNLNLAEIGRFFGLGDGLMGQQGNFESIVNLLFGLMLEHRVERLPIYLAPHTGAFHQYSSFGFLPALEHLWVLDDLRRQYKIDKKRIMAFGSGYGGYIASLMGKFAPFTFSLIVDVSGYCLTDLGEVFGGSIGRAGIGISRTVEDQRYTIPVIVDTIWSMEETSENYFSDAHRQIRSLLSQSHRVPSPTVHCHYHSVEDGLISIDLKDRLCHVLEKYNPVYYKRVTEADLDGDVFKNLAHGMGASLTKIFDLSMEEYRNMPNAKEDDIDFDRNITYGFPCSDRLYNFIYTEKGLDVRIEPIIL